MQSFDFYPYLPQLQVNGSEGYKTKVGGAITLTIAIGIILSCIAFCRELFEKTNPIVLNSINFDEGPTLSKDSIALFMAPLLPGAVAIPDAETYFKFTVEMSDTDAVNSTRPSVIMSSFDLQRCPQTTMYAQKELYTQYLFQDFDYYYCLNPGTEDRLLNLYGSFGNLKFVLWNLIVSPCTNTTENSNSCKPIEEISSALQLFYIHLEIKNMLVDSFDLETPLKPIFSSRLMRVSSFNSRDDILYFTPISYATDNGFILEDKSLIEGFEITQTQTDSQYVSAQNLNDSYMLKIKITLENQKILFLRGYIKIQTIAANIGGLAKFLILVLGFVNNRYNHTFFLKHIHYKVLKPAENSIPLQDHSELLKVEFPKASASNNKDYNSSPQLGFGISNHDRSQGITLNNFLAKDSHQIKLTFMEVLGYLVGLRSKNPSFLQKVNEKFNQHFKIESLIKILIKDQALIQNLSNK